jgi:glucosamine--fructose-6-phosphate aminotransferase (isomerizing)
MLEYTKEVVYVNDYELAIIKPGELVLKNLGKRKDHPLCPETGPRPGSD